MTGKTNARVEMIISQLSFLVSVCRLLTMTTALIINLDLSHVIAKVPLDAWIPTKSSIARLCHSTPASAARSTPWCENGR
jgi:hypothetical protein